MTNTNRAYNKSSILAFLKAVSLFPSQRAHLLDVMRKSMSPKLTAVYRNDYDAIMGVARKMVFKLWYNLNFMSDARQDAALDVVSLFMQYLHEVTEISDVTIQHSHYVHHYFRDRKKRESLSQNAIQLVQQVRQLFRDTTFQRDVIWPNQPKQNKESMAYQVYPRFQYVQPDNPLPQVIPISSIANGSGDEGKMSLKTWWLLNESAIPEHLRSYMHMALFGNH